jgi:hypothetical protein
MLPGLREQLERRRFTILLFAILAMTVVPLLRGGRANQASGLLVGFVLLAAVHAVSGKPRRTLVFTILAVIVFGGRLGTMFGGRFDYKDQWDAGSYVVAAGFMAVIVVRLYTSIIRGSRINGDTVMGAICVYLLIGYTWAYLYALVELVEPGSFGFPAYAQPGPGTPPEFTFGYYSFVTLTTLGYGDITPITPRARTLSWLEAVAGVSYMATVIAFLVSQITVDRESGHKL